MNKRSCFTWATILLICVMAGDASAQRREREGGGGGRGGRGMGMGMGRGPSSLIPLAGNPAVQKDLAVKEEAAPKIAKIVEDFGKELQTTLGETDFGSLRDLSSEERAKKMEEMRDKSAAAAKSLTEKFKPELAKVLDEKQMERLQQIYIQSLGSNAVMNTDVASALKITDEQKTKLDGLSKEYRDKQTALFSEEGGGDPTERFSKMRELGEERDAKLLEVLTADQSKELETMKGEPFDLAQLRGGGRGGEGRGFGRGGQGGGRPDGAGRPQRKSEAPAEKTESK